MDLAVGQPFTLPGADLAHLRAVLQSAGAPLGAHPEGWVVSRVAGHVVLPSGDVVRIASDKARNASLLAWLSYVAPALSSLSLFGLADELAADGDVGEVVARAFTGDLARILASRGMRRHYERSKVRTATLRGRIEFSELARTGGLLGKVPCTVWTRRERTPLNRFLAAAIEVIARDRLLRDAAGPAFSALRVPSPACRRSSPPSWLSGTTNLDRQDRDFQTAVTFARLLLQGAGLREGTNGRGPSFLINLETLFERTVDKVFRDAGIEANAKHPVAFTLLQHLEGPPFDGMPSDSTATSHHRRSFQLDLFCTPQHGAPFVVDAKYKTSISSGNLQQMVTYCFLTGAKRAVLVVPHEVTVVGDSYSFRSPSGDHTIRVDVAALRTDGEAKTD